MRLLKVKVYKKMLITCNKMRIFKRNLVYFVFSISKKKFEKAA